MLYTALTVVVVAAAIWVSVTAYRKHARRRRREEAVRTFGGRLCVNCGRYVHPAAKICKHCYTPQP